MISRSARLGVAVALLAVLGALVGHRLWLALTDPASAECSDPPIALGQQRAAPTHRELDVVFTCEDVRLAGTIYLPAGWGPSPGVVWVHGAGEAARLGWGGRSFPVWWRPVSRCCPTTSEEWDSRRGRAALATRAISTC
jgi:hypothetical protein